MNDQDILGRIEALVAEEHELREAAGTGNAPDQGRLKHLEESLDQCWDLLRQRRAKLETGDNPDEASTRSVREVEGYKQ